MSSREYIVRVNYLIGEEQWMRHTEKPRDDFSS